MVKRYASQKKPLYADAPWWEKNRMKALGTAVGISLFFIFAPMVYDIFRRPKFAAIAEFHPSSHDDIRQLRRRMIQRDKDLVDSPYGKF